MDFRRIFPLVFLAAFGCAGVTVQVQNGEDAETEAGGEDDPGVRVIDIPAGEGLSASCDREGKFLDLCRAERACIEGSGESCHEAGTFWKEGTVMEANSTWAFLFFRRGCDAGNEASCDEIGLEAAQEVAGEVEEEGAGEEPVIEEEEIEAEPEPAMTTKEREPPYVSLEEGAVEGRGLPVVARDGGTIANLAMYPGAEGDDEAAVVTIMDTAEDAEVYRKVIATAGELLDYDEVAEEIAARVEEVNDRLEETEWMEMTVVTQGPDVVRDCEHLEETDDGEVCVQKLELGDVKLRYADPYLMIDDEEKVVRGWTSGDKKCPAYLASVATGPGGDMLLFEVRYDCDKIAPRLHVLKTR